MRSVHGDLRLGSGSDRRGGSGQGRAHRGRCLDHGGQRGAAQHRAEGHGRRVTGGCWRAWPRRAASRRHTAEDLARLDRKRKAQEALEPGLGLEERPRGQDRQDEGRHDPSGLQARVTRWIWAPARWWPPSYTRPTRATRRRWRRRWRAAKANLEAAGRGTDGRRPGRMCDRQGLSLTVRTS